MISSLTYFVALDQEYFLKEGVEVKGIPIQTSNDIATSLINGDIDLAIELSVVPLLARSESIPDEQSPYLIFSTSAITESNGFDSVIVSRDSPLSDFKQLSNQKVAVFPGTTAQRTLIDVFTTLYPQTPPPIAIPMAPTLHLGVLERGEVAAVHAYEPYLSVGLVKHGFRRLRGSLYATQQSPSPIGVAAIHRKWQAANGSRAEATIRALDRAASFIDAFPDQARLIAAKYTGAEPDVAMVMNIMPMSTSDSVDADGLQRYFQKLLELGEITRVPEVRHICR